MGKLKNSYITDQGKSMLLGGGTLTYTKAVMYEQNLRSLTVNQIKRLVAINQPIMETQVAVTSADGDDSTTVNVRAIFKNTNLTADQFFNAIGFFAKVDNSEEKLVAISVASEGAYLAAASPSGVPTDAVDITLAIAIGDATTVNALVDPAGSVTPAMLDASIHQAKQDIQKILDNDMLNSNAPAIDGTFDANGAFDGWRKFWGTLPKNLPTNAANQGYIGQYKLSDTGSCIEFCVTIGSTNENQLFYRFKNANQWSEWLQVASNVQINDLRNQIQHIKDNYASVSALNTLSDTVAANKQSTEDALKNKVDKTELNSQIDSVKSEISRIDFTPYAKVVDVDRALSSKANSADVARDLQDYTTTAELTRQLDAINSTVNSKENIGTSYSKAEIDRKLLAISSSTDGKVDANQVASMIENKVDKSTVEQAINTLKESTMPIYRGTPSDDLLSFKTTQLRYYTDNFYNLKNSPPFMSDVGFLTAKYIFASDDVGTIIARAFYSNGAYEVWENLFFHGKCYGWKFIASRNEINIMDNKIMDLTSQLKEVVNQIKFIKETLKINQ